MKPTQKPTFDGLPEESSVETEYRYGSALVMVVAAALLLLFGREGTLLWLLVMALQVGAVLAVYATTDLTPRLVGRAVVVAILILGVVASSLVFDRPNIQVATGILGASLSVSLAVTVLRAVSIQPIVDGRTILGAVTVYMLIGLLFTELFWVAAAWTEGMFFVDHPDPSVRESVYFSYVTLTTLGYGDLSPATELGRALAVFEALLGQLYLVTVVALIVGNYGARRSSA